MRRQASHFTLNLLLILALSLMVLAVSVPGCQPSSPAKEKAADFEIKQQDGHIKIDIDRDGNGGLKVDIQKKELPTDEKKTTEEKIESKQEKVNEPATAP